MRAPCAYLAGSIEGLEPEEAENWRVQAAKYLKECGIDSFDPYTAYPQPVSAGEIPKVWNANITKIAMSEIFLCKLNPNGRSVGSIRELQIALDQKKDVYLVDEHLYYGPRNSVWDVPLYKELGDALLDIKNRWGEMIMGSQWGISGIQIENGIEVEDLVERVNRKINSLRVPSIRTE